MMPAISSSPRICHPERSLAESEATRQTQSRDPYRTDAADGSERNFRVVVRFFDEHEAEFSYDSSRGAAAWECSARKRRVSVENAEGSRREVTLGATKQP